MKRLRAGRTPENIGVWLARAESHSEGGPCPVSSFDTGDLYSPGILFAMDLDTGTTLRLDTNQGDSEPLIVQDGFLYYRVTDQILRAPVRGNALGTPELLAMGDELRDVHWAFLGRSPEAG